MSTKSAALRPISEARPGARRTFYLTEAALEQLKRLTSENQVTQEDFVGAMILSTESLSDRFREELEKLRAERQEIRKHRSKKKKLVSNMTTEEVEELLALKAKMENGELE